MPPVASPPSHQPARAVPARWRAALDAVLAEPHRVAVHHQPIVDLRRGVVVGHEALARFPAEPAAGPRAWFAAAADLGCAGRLEAQVLQAALVQRALAVRGRFVAVNLSPSALLSMDVQAVLVAAGSLERVVVEVTGARDGAALAEVRAILDALRRRGAAIAVDDAGADPSVLDRLVALRPEYVKVDGSLIAGLERDPRRADVVRRLGELAARLDAAVVAEGVEDVHQLDALIALGVPFAQGYVLGRPQPSMGGIPPWLTQHIRSRTIGDRARHQLAAIAARDVVALPEALRLPGGLPLADAARRAMARPAETRFDPLVVLDESGSPCGAVTVDRLLLALAA